MSLRKVRLPYKKERCLLSDVLPYEIPISFSNRHFFRFVLRHKITVENDSIFWLKSTPVVDKIVSLLFALPDNQNRISVETKFIGETQRHFVRYRLDDAGPATSRFPKPDRFLNPFAFRVRHKEMEFRELSISHPRSQLLVVDFYDRCKETILHYTSRSSYTIRAPMKVAKVQYFKDRLHFQHLSKEHSIIEQSGLEYETLRSFFVYKEYSNIHKFYESYRYHRAEKKFNKLIKLDISKCFDSIYTHSIGWAVIGKEAQKENLQKSKGTFPDRFDKLMQNMNFGETNGILIGPEFSRIFAEIILQAVDQEVERELKDNNKPLHHRRNYEAFRYVDDYFIFFNNDVEKTRIMDQLQYSLRRYKLSLNAAKAIEYQKPIITKITMAKQQISNLLEKKIRFHREKAITESDEVVIKGRIFVNSKSLITDFKTIIWTCGVEYQDMLNYSLAIVEIKFEEMMVDYLAVSEERRLDTQFVKSISYLFEFVFFIYSVSPRVNTTIRLCRILFAVISFLKSGHFNDEQCQLIFKQIHDDVCFILKKTETEELIQVETLYLLLVLSELGREYWLEEGTLGEYLGFHRESGSKMESPGAHLNHFSITVSLFYMKDKVRYDRLREQIMDIALDRIKMRRETCHKESELVFLLFDLISCPYISQQKKFEALKEFGVTDSTTARELVDFKDGAGRPQTWFTSWRDFDFGRELDAKRSQEVY
ncbi:MAG: RNA-directed DNA polymerase [Rhodospirillaceae bacterium]|nr:RNA-directed DNA polymerase [Rhodospirillaceae bacterium]